MRFRTTVLLGGKTATGLLVPPEVIEALAAGRQPKVQVTVGGHTYRSSVGVRGGQFLIPLSAENRTAAGVAAGDEVDVEVTLDTAPREVEVPADLAAVFAADPEAQRLFDGLPFTHRKEYVRWIEEAKKPETRQNRLGKTVERLKGGS
ncbi:YdeI/OmpD-associated family protein [Kutzneria sp. CA-103260]|uniref:YdeI/OmpD-associated family protein n=1 Tax=Kutzneria sp. CA-103260 TaxID=2802641 RepID=UPI001BA4D75F|nr:YdeI/OmpD-associated family protein [Kutzneria sp. CA-103260]QUQ67326.1 Bacteriocin-protection, YdeI or OmpD-Associated [Kutzneria sp. CA-103260]